MDCMAYWTAATYYRVPFLCTFFSSFLGSDKPARYVVFHKKDLFIREKTKVHLCTASSPENAVRTIFGQKIVSPELLYLQLCSELKITQAILLGCMLCSVQEGSGQMLTTPDKLREFAKNSSYVHGRTLALQALQYIEGNFYSPLEIMLYMILALPNRLGGMGYLGKLKANIQISISIEQARKLGQQYCYLVPDLCDLENMRIFEYDGEDYHRTKEQKQRDKDRRDVFRSIGFKVEVFTHKNLYCLKNLSKTMKKCAKESKQRIRIQNSCFREMFEILHNLLPRRKKLVNSERLVNERNNFYEEFGVLFLTPDGGARLCLALRTKDPPRVPPYPG